MNNRINKIMRPGLLNKSSVFLIYLEYTVVHGENCYFLETRYYQDGMPQKDLEDVVLHLIAKIIGAKQKTNLYTEGNYYYLEDRQKYNTFMEIFKTFLSEKLDIRDIRLGINISLKSSNDFKEIVDFCMEYNEKYSHLNLVDRFGLFENE